MQSATAYGDIVMWDDPFAVESSWEERPLCDRRDEIPALALSFLAAIAPDGPQGFTAAAMSRLRRHQWSGGVFELRRIIEIAASVCDGAMLDDVTVGFALETGESEHQYERQQSGRDVASRIVYQREPELLQEV